ncbi:hypothetical protein [Acinetobacter gerneri]|uniref:hypothetical protein n=1 Tax=Acinetobacter gerneri TaxID=202952 RepID=UPI0028AF1FBD|nr:hypothetical protein [Acinetobacter gerneri]
MNIIYRNDTDKVIRVFIEPSTDEFFLNKNDEIKIVCNSLESISEISHTYSNNESIIIWFPRSTKGTVFINDVHVESLSESRYW